MNSAADLTDALVQARRARGWTQHKLARQAGVSQRALSKWELRQAEPSLTNLCRWASALDYLVLVEPLPAGVM